MKKILALLLIIICVLSLVACGGDDTDLKGDDGGAQLPTQDGTSSTNPDSWGVGDLPPVNLGDDTFAEK